jgi:hypothetical protein
MMRIQTLLNKLINSTEKTTLKWYRIDHLKGDINLANYLNEHEHHGKPTIDFKLFVELKNSYYLRYKNGYVFLFEEFAERSPDDNYFILGIQEDNSKIIELNTYTESQADLLKLYNSIQEQINNVDGLINALLNDKSI